MARSIRNSQALKAKSVKRKGFFTDVVNARAERIAQKLKQDLEKQKEEEKKKKAAENNGEEPEEKMAVDLDEDHYKKISTSGWRTSRHVTYKKNNIKKNKRRAALVFK